MLSPAAHQREGKSRGRSSALPPATYQQKEAGIQVTLFVTSMTQKLIPTPAPCTVHVGSREGALPAEVYSGSSLKARQMAPRTAEEP